MPSDDDSERRRKVKQKEVQMDFEAANKELNYIRHVMERTHFHIGRDAWYFVFWGVIVLIWYPARTLLLLSDMGTAPLDGLVAIAALAGTAVFFLGFKRRQGNTEHKTFVGQQVNWMCWSYVMAAAVLTMLASGGLLAGSAPWRHIPVIWGFAWAHMAFGVGVIYSREYLVSAVVIFSGSVVAMSFPHFNGLILGPCMGLGMIVPGIISMRRVRKMTVVDECGDNA